MLTAYPLNQGVFDWALENDAHNFSPSKIGAKAADPNFVGSFTTASMDHYHFEAGVLTSL